jgi:hypothetical protein
MGWILRAPGSRGSKRRRREDGLRARDLLKLYVYGYLNRVRSSRRLEREASAISKSSGCCAEDALRGYWNKPDEDRDWDVVHITRFLDSLIEVGSARAVNRVAADAGEAAR